MDSLISQILTSASAAKHKSMGMGITQKRLDFINDVNDNRYSIEIKNLEQGTEVVVRMKI